MENNEMLEETVEVLAQNKKEVITLSDGTEVEIFKCKTRNIGSLLRLVSHLFAELEVDSTDKIPDLKLSNPINLLQLIAKFSEQVFPVAAQLCSIQDEKEFDDLYIDDAVAIIVKEVEVNKPFFLNQVLPYLNGLMGDIGQDTSADKTGQKPTAKRRKG